MGYKIKVAAEKLHQRANEIKANVEDWPTEAPKVTPPDGLKSTASAVDNLNAYGESLQQYTDATKQESLRMAAMLRDTATAYDNVDKSGKTAIEQTAAVEAIPIPQTAGAEVQLPSAPPPPTMVTSDGYATVPDTEELLNNPGASPSLIEAMAKASTTQACLVNQVPESNVEDWEGDAADAAFAKFNLLRDWIGNLSIAWGHYGTAALAILNGHTKAMAEHKPIAAAYKDLENAMDDLLNGTNPSQADIDAVANRMEEEERKSLGVRDSYAQSARPEMPTPPRDRKSVV